MENVKQYIAKKYLQKQRDLIEDAMMTYGSVITKNGRILTVKEMENLFFDEDSLYGSRLDCPIELVEEVNKKALTPDTLTSDKK